MTVSVAVDDDARILAMRAEHLENAGSFAAAGSSSIGFVGMVLPGPYRIPRVAYSGKAVYTNTMKPAWSGTSVANRSSGFRAAGAQRRSRGRLLASAAAAIRSRRDPQPLRTAPRDRVIHVLTRDGL